MLEFSNIGRCCVPDLELASLELALVFVIRATDAGSRLGCWWWGPAMQLQICFA